MVPRLLTLALSSRFECEWKQSSIDGFGRAGCSNLLQDGPLAHMECSKVGGLLCGCLFWSALLTFVCCLALHADDFVL